MKKLFYFLFVISGFILSGCHKDKKPNSLDLVKDSVFYYAKEDYLWYASLPSYETFKPRSYTGADDITALTSELDAISQIPINPATNKPYEYYDGTSAKYSFIDDGTVSDELNGVQGNFGFAPLYNEINDLRIKYVYPGSPADLAGIKRGYQITSINGRTNISYDTDGYGDNSGNNLKFVINAYSNSNSISMTLLKPDGSTLTVTNMNVTNYTVNPVLKSAVYDQGNGHKVGYIVFNSFTSGANANPKLDAAFGNFIASGVTDLVVDLRYNGGGYVSTAEYIDNLIVPTASSGTLMYNTYYNDILTTGKESLLKNQVRKDPSTGEVYNYGQFSYTVADNAVNFTKRLNLNVNRVFFIITGSTASASELTINNLRPIMDVQFIGSQSYGKPVGFFDIDINKYQMYIPEFSTKNSANQGDYYAGFTPNTAGYPGVQDYDDVTKEFGDPTEILLAHALNYVKNGTYTLSIPVIQSLASKRTTFSVQAQNKLAVKMDKHKFNGLVFDKKLKLKR
ncbi:MAG TPA: S41 family peptidase [Mucilaginibacter sp.]|nr:S41 family peptidase [Mucilaginibacter sp.]